MNEVKVKKNALLDKLRANRAQHEADYATAYDVWADGMITQLKKNLAYFKKERKSRAAPVLVQPVSYVKQYDQAIAILEMSVDDEIILDANEFNQYVLDNWNWKQMFTTVNSNYLSGKINAV